MAKKIPMRMCVACRQMKPKIELIRVVKTPEGEILASAGAKVNGRGAYICRDKTCIEKAQKAGALSRALDTQVSKEVYENLKRECDDLEE